MNFSCLTADLLGIQSGTRGCGGQDRHSELLVVRCQLGEREAFTELVLLRLRLRDEPQQ
ncbi:hypothetical protein ACIHCQ_28090 [Streptomyces sp. NPDC052236]|uniref:hypothetical protein n=1 Tax=Streptomyces sp. NPDC052236 TaxID=3365686 RepID=UPI0037D08E53